MIITIDGYSCQGKSYIGRTLSNTLELEFLSTGKIVRYVAYQYTKIQDRETKTEHLLDKAVEIMKNTSIPDILKCEYLDTRITEQTLRIVAEYPYVFDSVVEVIIDYASNRNIVLDGRFTFNIFPNAHRCYYFLSSIERRASLVSRSKNISHEEALDYIQFRDSFEKKYIIPDYVKKVNMDSYPSADVLVQYLKNDVLS